MNKDTTDFKSWFDALVERVKTPDGEMLQYSDEIVEAFDAGKSVEEYAQELEAK